MEVIQTEIAEVLIFEPKVFGDARGYFYESFRKDVIEKHIGNIEFVQDNQSKSGYGVLRGLHFQKPPFTQSKLVTCLEGEVLDVAVDMRVGSPTFGKHVKAILNAELKRQMFVPKGFAHGFVVLSETAVFAYKCDNYYAPEYDGGIAFNDPALGIEWPIPESDMKLSDKDLKQPLLKNVNIFEYPKFTTEHLYRNK